MTADPASWAAIPNGPTATTSPVSTSPVSASPVSTSPGAATSVVGTPVVSGEQGVGAAAVGKADDVIPAVFHGDAVVAGPALVPPEEPVAPSHAEPVTDGPAGSRPDGSGSRPDGAAETAEAGAAPSREGTGPAGGEPGRTGDEPAPTAADIPAGGDVAETAPGGDEPERSGDGPRSGGPGGFEGDPGSAGGERRPAEADPGSPTGGPGSSGAEGGEAAGDDRPHSRPAERVPEVGEWRGIVLVTGTDTDVGKTIVTSAIAAAAQAAGLRVAVVKPGQTGTADGGPTDIDLINRLAAPHTTRTLASYPEALAPLAAARFSEMPALELYEVVDAVRAEADKHDLVLVEGAGGLLVPMGVRPSGEQWTFADLAVALGVGTIVVTRAGLGTLNHTALTLEALARRGVPAGVILGAWPAEPELVHWANLSELVPHLVGALPDGAGAMDPGVFRRSAPGWLTPALYGVLDDWRVWAEEVS